MLQFLLIIKLSTPITCFERSLSNGFEAICAEPASRAPAECRQPRRGCDKFSSIQHGRLPFKTSIIGSMEFVGSLCEDCFSWAQQREYRPELFRVVAGILQARVLGARNLPERG